MHSPALRQQFLNAHPLRTLKVYQDEAVAFMAAAEARGEGGIVGDDMRLGKTLEYLTFWLRDMQRRVAADTGCAFFDTWIAMGGDGPMARWYAASRDIPAARHAADTFGTLASDRRKGCVQSG